MSLIYPLSLNAWYTGIATLAHNARNREQAQLAYTIDRACKLWPAVENTLMTCWETISRRNTNACSVSCEGTMRGRGGPITAAVDVPGGDQFWRGDHRRRDKFVDTVTPILRSTLPPKLLQKRYIASVQ